LIWRKKVREQLSLAAALPGPQSPPDRLRHSPQCLPVFDIQFHYEGALIALPRIAVGAADEPITVVIYLDERSATAFAATKHGSCVGTGRVCAKLIPRTPLLRYHGDIRSAA
jgi:hypothetical protein